MTTPATSNPGNAQKGVTPESNKGIENHTKAAKHIQKDNHTKSCKIVQKNNFRVIIL